MQKLLGPILSLVAVAACTAPGNGQLELRSSGSDAVTGNAFVCSGNWPSDLTPCNLPVPSQPATSASGTADLIELSLHRSLIPVDGGSSTVVIDLEFGATDLIGATARVVTSTSGTFDPLKTSEATAGWIEPVLVGRMPQERNTGRFSISFSFGTINGTYDTAPAM